ncbi:hypothetical protein HYC85_013428 [Camellia sinensis]|uniref:Uncharacterized protein n=1 Tax=Camellia sinensis TaxID=4442 RepID=A0A7J7H5E7_CAMSI|nr:hypothetical protein HYC85_013428 [Camellia sinensis]
MLFFEEPIMLIKFKFNPVEDCNERKGLTQEQGLCFREQSKTEEREKDIKTSWGKSKVGFFRERTTNERKGYLLFTLILEFRKEIELEDDSTKEDETEVDKIKLVEATGMLSKLPTIEHKNADMT